MPRFLGRYYIIISSMLLSVIRVARGPNYPRDSDSVCPVCNNEMEKGYIVSNNGVFWNDHVPKFSCTGEPIGPNGQRFRVAHT
jgi:hypothetical protein